VKMLNKILQEVLKINEVKGYNAFFDYSGHVNNLTVRVYQTIKEGYSINEYISIADIYKLKELHNQLRKLLKEIR